MSSSSTTRTVQRQTLEVGDEAAVRQKLAAKLNLGSAASKAPFGSNADRPALTSTFAKSIQSPAVSAAAEEQPSLMEQMMAEAMGAREVKQVEEGRLKKEFGKGLKKGFLSSSNTRSSSTSKLKAKAPVAASTTSAAPSSSIPTLIGNKKSIGGNLNVASTTGIVLPEVQEVMGAMPPASDWLTPDLLAKLSAKPHLLQALQSPQFSKALELMRTGQLRQSIVNKHSCRCHY
jgi:hypothetical protein